MVAQAPPARDATGKSGNFLEPRRSPGKFGAWLPEPTEPREQFSAAIANFRDFSAAAANFRGFSGAAARVWLPKQTTKVGSERRACVTSVASCATCALCSSHCRTRAFRRIVNSTAGFGCKSAGFDRKNGRFRAQSGARMRHMCSIVGFSSIPTVLKFPANFRARDTTDFRSQNHLDLAATPPLSRGEAPTASIAYCVPVTPADQGTPSSSA